jgi:hypothetical protein
MFANYPSMFRDGSLRTDGFLVISAEDFDALFVSM